MKTKYKHIHFEYSDIDEHWLCINNKARGVVAFIVYYKLWKRWVLETMDGCVFDIGCLQDIIHFIGQL